MPRAALKQLFVENCANGRHVPLDEGKPDSLGKFRTTCRRCGCPLVCVFGSRWILSGQLG